MKNDYIAALANLGWMMPSLVVKYRHSSFAERHDPKRKKTPEDLERIEAARLKQERKKKT